MRTILETVQCAVCVRSSVFSRFWTAFLLHHFPLFHFYCSHFSSRIWLWLSLIWARPIYRQVKSKRKSFRSIFFFYFFFLSRLAHENPERIRISSLSSKPKANRTFNFNAKLVLCLYELISIRKMWNWKLLPSMILRERKKHKAIRLEILNSNLNLVENLN